MQYAIVIVLAASLYANFMLLFALQSAESRLKKTEAFLKGLLKPGSIVNVKV